MPSNLMQRGASFLGSRLKTAGGRSVSYTPASGTQATITATPKLVVYGVANSEGLVTQVESWDWIITADDLSADPNIGDQIAETINGVVTTYETMTIGDKPVFEWADTAGILFVVHSKKVTVA